MRVYSSRSWRAGSIQGIPLHEETIKEGFDLEPQYMEEAVEKYFTDTN